MKILLLSWNFRPVIGGIEAVVGHLFDGLRQRGHEVRLLVPWVQNAAPEAHVLRAARPGLKSFVQHCLTAGWSVCRTLRPEVILCGSLVGAPAAIVLSRAFACPYVVLVHGSDILRPGWFYQRAIRFLLSRADRLACNSRRTRDILLTMGIQAQRTEVIYPGVRIDESTGIGPTPDPYPGRRVLLSVGRLIRRKGLLEFVERVMPRLARDDPSILLLIVGEDARASLVHPERMHERICQKVRELKLQEHVSLTGAVPDEELRRLLARADLFVLPALDLPGDVEGFGIVIMEAAAAGVPAVATRTGGIPEAVVDGQTGVLVDGGDYESLYRQIRRLLDDQELRQKLGLAAADRARSQFAWNIVVRQYERLLLNCARSSRGI